MNSNHELSENMSRTSTTLSNHLKCASHTLNLIASKDIEKILKFSKSSKIHYTAFGKCTSLWNASKRPHYSEKIKDLTGISLKYPVPTR